MLFKDVNRKNALLMVLFVSIGCAVSLAVLIFKFAPLTLLSGSAYLSGFTKEQIEAVNLILLNIHYMGGNIVTIFWGLWLFPFGYLVYKSGFIPRIYGMLLYIAGIAYLFGSGTAIVYPSLVSSLAPILIPMYFCELPIVFWLLIKGTKKEK
jgi:hypothetical protein